MSAIVAQPCISLDDWTFEGDNGDGTCDYDILVIVNSGNGASGTVTLTLGPDVVYTGTCVCNPSTVGFTVTVPCNSDIEIEGEWDGPGNGNDCSGTTGTFSLPVIWHKELAAKTVDDEVVLSFETAQEYNSAYFEIQHSEGDHSRFEFLTKISAQGYAQTRSAYSYTHKNPSPGLHYYRLVQVDLDGREVYGDIVRVEVTTRGTNKVYPNPSVFEVTIVSKAVGDCHLVDHTGRILATYRVGDQPVTIDLSTYPAGLYLLRYADGHIHKLAKR